ncbi:DUF898 family protein [Enterobacter asburiae]|nr:DUF898 family protein [Enterobacter asburiae]
MKSSESAQSMPQTSFSFHGKAGKYFIICLVNVLLVFITLGIYLPWAMVKCRRYIYSNMELNGARFNYHASGGAFFVSWLLMLVIIVTGVIICHQINPALTGLLVIAFTILMPLMAIKSWRYQAMMTSLHNVRFGFHCSAGTAYWTMLILPLILIFASLIVIVLVKNLMGNPSDMTGFLLRIATTILVTFVVIGMASGILFHQWMKLPGKSASFGIHKFNINVSLIRCVSVSILSIFILAPFCVLMTKTLGLMMLDIIMFTRTRELNDEHLSLLVMKYQAQLITSYLLYFAGVIITVSFAIASLRNLFINGLKLGESLTFRSTVTFIGMLNQIVVLALTIAFTCGLAYPWAKMRLLRYLAANTHVIGSLDELELRDSDEPNDSGF